jgi:flavodoxin
MNISNLIKITGLVIILIIIVIVVGVNFVALDVMSNTATGSEILNPAGVSVGRALVVYNPGISGAAKNAAITIANDLRSKGYTVDLAGVKSQAAGNVSSYNIIVAGGPTYGGATSKSITAFLKALTPPKNASLGIFATGGFSWNNTIPWYEQDNKSITEEVIGLWGDSPLYNTPTIKVIRGDEADNDCADFVSTLMAQERRS